MSVRNLVFAGAVGLLASPPLNANEPALSAPPGNVVELGPVVTSNSAQYRVESQSVGKSFVVDVFVVGSEALPPSSDIKLPVVFVTDADLVTTMAPAVATMGFRTGQFAPMIVVGIGYGQDLGRAEIMLRRNKDMTPVYDPEKLAAAPLPPAVREGLADRLGGSDALLGFINDELKPFIASRYPADLEDTTLVGASLGGLFTLHVLFSAPDSFDRYVAISPSALIFDPQFLLDEEAGLDDVPARLFVGLGGNDAPEIVEMTAKLDAQIRRRARPQLRYTYRVFPDETHLSVLPSALTAGLFAVFDRPAGPPPGMGPPSGP